MSIFYHGSQQQDLKILKPSPSILMDGKSVVFATPSLTLAITMIPKWNNDDFEVGSYQGQLYCIEQYQHAFRDKMNHVNGVVYQVSTHLFHSDERVGMIHHEYISNENVPVLGTIKIDNVLATLKASKDIHLVTFEDKMKAIFSLKK